MHRVIGGEIRYDEQVSSVCSGCHWQKGCLMRFHGSMIIDGSRLVLEQSVALRVHNLE